MYCNIFEKVCSEPLGEIQLKKLARKTRGEGGEIFIEPLGRVAVFLPLAVTVKDH